VKADKQQAMQVQDEAKKWTLPHYFLGQGQNVAVHVQIEAKTQNWTWTSLQVASCSHEAES
jgi:hypothetical protein